MTLTPRGLGLLASAVLLYATARALGIPELQLVAVAAVLLVVLAAVFVVLAAARLEPQRRVRPVELHHGASADVQLLLRNRGRLPTAELEVTDPLPPGFGTGAGGTLPPLAPGGRARLDARLLGAHRGRVGLGPVQVRQHDPFRLVVRHRELPCPGELLVYPKVWELPAGLPLGGARSPEGTDRPRPATSGDDRSTVREYVRGDDLRSVHWPSTAHRGKLMVRQPEMPEQPRAVVHLDRSVASQLPSPTFEAAVATAASALFHLDRRGRGVVLVDGPLGRGGTGPRPAEGWLRDLATALPDHGDPARIWQQLASGAAGDGALVAVVGPPSPDALHHLIRAGRTFSSRAAVVVTSPAVLRDREAHVQDVVGALRGAGWRVTVIVDDRELPEAWQELIAAHPRLAGVSR